MSDTPETDSCLVEIDRDWHRDFKAFDLLLAHACNLERDRDSLRAALQRLADCDWVITLPDRMDAVRKIARDALEGAK